MNGRFNLVAYRQRGAALLEFIVVFPVFIAVLLAAVDFGVFFSDKLLLQEAAVKAAKFRAQFPRCGEVTELATKIRAVYPVIGLKAALGLNPSFTITKVNVNMPPIKINTKNNKGNRIYPVAIEYKTATPLSKLYEAIWDGDGKVTGFAACDFACDGFLRGVIKKKCEG